MDAAGHPSVIPGDDGDRLVPSVVTLTQKGEVVRRQQSARGVDRTSPTRTVYSIKRLMAAAWRMFRKN